jgi:hypothetical protein
MRPVYLFTALRTSDSSSSAGWSCLEYILYWMLSLNDNLPASTSFLVAVSLDLGRPIDSRNLTAWAG